MLKNLAMPVFLSHFLLEDFVDVDDLRKPLPDVAAEKCEEHRSVKTFNNSRMREACLDKCAKGLQHVVLQIYRSGSLSIRPPQKQVKKLPCFG